MTDSEKLEQLKKLFEHSSHLHSDLVKVSEATFNSSAAKNAMYIPLLTNAYLTLFHGMKKVFKEEEGEEKSND